MIAQNFDYAINKWNDVTKHQMFQNSYQKVIANLRNNAYSDEFNRRMRIFHDDIKTILYISIQMMLIYVITKAICAFN